VVIGKKGEEKKGEERVRYPLPGLTGSRAAQLGKEKRKKEASTRWPRAASGLSSPTGGKGRGKKRRGGGKARAGSRPTGRAVSNPGNRQKEGKGLALTPIPPPEGKKAQAGPGRRIASKGKKKTGVRVPYKLLPAEEKGCGIRFCAVGQKEKKDNGAGPAPARLPTKKRSNPRSKRFGRKRGGKEWMLVPPWNELFLVRNQQGGKLGQTALSLIPGRWPGEKKKGRRIVVGRH